MRNPTLLFVAALLLSACASRYDVRTDHDPEADLSAYRSFAIAPRERVDTPNQFDNSLVLKRIDVLAIKHLTARGLARTVPADADLLVRFWLTAEEKTAISSMPAAPFYGPWPGPYPYPYSHGRWGAMYDEVIVRNYVQGTLVFDLVDAKRDELVWRTYVVGTVSRDRDAAFAALDEALGRALTEWPTPAAPRP